MDGSLFLVARMHLSDPWQGNTSWIVEDDPPYELLDPIDVPESLLDAMYALYAATYRRIDDALNIPSPIAFFEFSRWILVQDDQGTLVGLLLLKPTPAGLKLGIVAASSAPDVTSALKCLLRQILNIDGVYAEVSDRLEQVLDGYVLCMASEHAPALTDKTVRSIGDGLHYERHIANVGPRIKILVGRPAYRET